MFPNLASIYILKRVAPKLTFPAPPRPNTSVHPPFFYSLFSSTLPSMLQALQVFVICGLAVAALGPNVVAASSHKNGNNAAISGGFSPPPPHTTSTARLSVARRNLGATVADGKAFFVGGCFTTGTGGSTQFICDNASTAIDVYSSSSSRGDGVSLDRTMHMSEARGWVSTCALDDSLVIMAGGGTSGVTPHSRVADIIDTSNNYTFSTHATALTNGRWGVACAAVNGRAYYLGGKVTVHGYSDAWTSPLVDVYTRSSNSWARAAYNLTEDKESAVAVAVGSGESGRVVVAGGWRYLANSKFGASSVVETLMHPEATNPQSVTGNMATKAYDVGIVPGPNGTVYLVGNEALHIAYPNGAVKTIGALPPGLWGLPSGGTGGGAIPATHMPNNGVAIGDNYVCFYAVKPNGLYCYNIKLQQWSQIECSAVHAGGSMVVLGNSVMIGGGFDPASKIVQATDLIDVITFTAMHE